MFGIKLRSWMEAHIVRPRKKRSKEGKSGKNGKGTVLPDPPMKSALAEPSSTVSSAASPATAPPTKRVTLVSPTPSSRVSHGDRGENAREEVRARLSLTACCAAGSSSPRRQPPQLPAAAHHRGRPNSPRGSSSSGQRYSTYLSSPESAYSTGYSTDATSPHGYSPGEQVLLFNPHKNIVRVERSML